MTDALHNNFVNKLTKFFNVSGKKLQISDVYVYLIETEDIIYVNVLFKTFHLFV